MQTSLGGPEGHGVGVLDALRTSTAGEALLPACLTEWRVSRRSDLAEKQDQVCKVCEVFRMPMVGGSSMGDPSGAKVCGGLRGLRSIGGGLP